MTILVTGGLGFIGSAFVRQTIQNDPDQHVVVVDKHTYAGDPRRLAGIPEGSVTVQQIDVGDPYVRSVVERLKPELIVHFAAETHVTRSEIGPEAFYRTNVEGTRNLLEASEVAAVPLFVHVSTDEVYGPATDRPFKESDKEPGEGLATSAYAKSKALADEVAQGFSTRIPVVVVRPTNCFGPWQHPEKAIPRWVTRALTGKRIPVWGDGQYIRDWFYVEDLCDALRLVIDRGRPGETYNIGPGRSDSTNLDIARSIASAAGMDEDAVYLTAYDRPDHDRKYAVDVSNLRSLGWTGASDLHARLEETVDWYRDHESWWTPFLDDAEGLYDDEEAR